MRFAVPAIEKWLRERPADGSGFKKAVNVGTIESFPVLETPNGPPVLQSIKVLYIKLAMGPP